MIQISGDLTQKIFHFRPPFPLIPLIVASFTKTVKRFIENKKTELSLSLIPVIRFINTPLIAVIFTLFVRDELRGEFPRDRRNATTDDNYSFYALILPLKLCLDIKLFFYR